MNPLRRQSLLLLKTLLVASLALPPLLLSLHGWRAAEQEWALADERITRALDVLHEHTLKVFRAADLVMEQLAEETSAISNDKIAADESRWHTRLNRVAAGLPQVHSMWLVGEDGRPLASSYVYPVPPSASLTDRDFFRAQLDADRRDFVGQVLVPRLSDAAPFFSLSRRRQTEDSRFLGVATVSLLPSDFERFYASLAGGQAGALFAMFKSDGNVLARYPKPITPSVSLHPSGPFFSQWKANPESGFVTAVSRVDNIERRSGYRRVAGLPVYVLAGYETRSITAGWLAKTAVYTAVGLPISWLLAATLAFSLRRTQRLYAEEDKVAATQAALQHSQRLEAMGRLTGGIAHDFNNLLMVISGGVDRLMRRRSDSGDQRYLDMISAAAKKGEQLTRQLLTFARRQAIVPEVIDVGGKLNELSDMLSQTLRGHANLVVEAPTHRIYANVDPTEFELAILNLASNARDAMERGGIFKIELRMLTAAPNVGSHLEIRASDTGIGMSEEVMNHIFDPFFTTKSAGNGLGLSQVYGFVNQAGGTIEVSSEVGSGSVFIIRLPACAPAPSTRQVEQAATTSLSVTGKVVMFIEDEPHVTDVCVSYLEQLGLRVEHHADASSALDALNTRPRPDLVISDILLPNGMNGYDLGLNIRARDPSIPILLITGFSGTTFAERGEFPVLPKPFGFEEFKNFIFANAPDVIDRVEHHRSPD
jgi:two-component system NtrC family sensor kinase